MRTVLIAGLLIIAAAAMATGFRTWNNGEQTTVQNSANSTINSAMS